jgi:hypothetical protein
MRRGKKTGHPASLWEVVDKQRLRESQKKAIAMASGSEPSQVKPEPVKKEPVKLPPKAIKTDNIGIFEKRKSHRKFSFDGIAKKLPFKVNPKAAMVIGLAIVAIILFIVNSGNNESVEQQPIDDSVVSIIKNDTVKTDSGSAVSADSALPPTKTVVPETPKKVTEPIRVVEDSKKDHIIVITVYQVKRDLEPVMAYFSKNGIETQIVKPSGSRFYYLISKNRYESPQRKGTDGSFAIAKIKSVGANYKSPTGYESFGKVPFQDSYGVNVYKSDLFKEIFNVN